MGSDTLDFAQVLLSNTMSDRQRVIPISRYITSMIVIGNRKNTNADTWNMYLILFCNSYGILQTNESSNGSWVLGSNTV
jgi:hypothetical protein